MINYLQRMGEREEQPQGLLDYVECVYNHADSPQPRDPRCSPLILSSSPISSS